MKCYTHSEQDAVANCGNCGVGMCKACVDESLMQLNNVRLCKSCAKQSAKANVSSLTKSVIWSGILTFWYGAALVLGLISAFNRDWNTEGIVTMFVAWGCARMVALLTPRQKSVGEDVFNHFNPEAAMIGGAIEKVVRFIVLSILMPVTFALTLFRFIKFVREFRLYREVNKHI